MPRNFATRGRGKAPAAPKAQKAKQDPCPWAAIRAMVPAVMEAHRDSLSDLNGMEHLFEALAISRNLYPGDARWARRAHGLLLRSMLGDLEGMGLLYEPDAPLLNALASVGSDGHTFDAGTWVKMPTLEEAMASLRAPSAGAVA